MSIRKFQLILPFITKLGSVRYSSGYKYYQILNEPQPDDIRTVAGGIPIIEPPKPKLTGVIQSRDPKEWKFVEALLPSPIVPDPPRHDVYPTPSGWVPPKPIPANAPYRVMRTRFHNFPIYMHTRDGGTRHFTIISKVQGDLWLMDADVQKYVTERTGEKTYTRVDEVCCKLWVRGQHMETLAQFLIDKGF